MKRLVMAVVGLIMGYGLAWSGLVQPEIVLSFLTLHDLGLLVTMASAIVVVAFLTRVVPLVVKKPPFGVAYKSYKNKLSGRTVTGSAVFGVGWGLTGLCPGAAIASIGVGNWPAALGLVGMLIGVYVYGVFIDHRVQKA